MAIDRAVGEIEREFGDAPCPATDAEDIHTWIESKLVEFAGEAGRKIHTARSRNDQVATLLVLYLIDAGQRLASRFAGLTRVFCERAKAWSDLAFPLQTHAQFAAPGTVGFWALRYAVAFERSRDFLALCLGAWRKCCPLGSGAVAGSSIGIDRRIQAMELGFDGPSPSALYSTTARDECLELLAVMAHASLHLQSFAADIIAFSQTPFGWTKYPTAFGTGSSMMPNKANPDAMELLRGECSGILSAHAHALTLLKGLPSGYNRDLQCLKPIVRGTVEKLAFLVEMTTAFMGELDFDRDRLSAAMQQGHIDATLRMEAKVREGTPLRDAHHAVAEELTRSASPPVSDVASLTVDQYTTIGSASPAETRRVANDLLAKLRPTGA